MLKKSETLTKFDGIFCNFVHLKLYQEKNRMIMKRVNLILGSLLTFAAIGGYYLTDGEIESGQKTYVKENLSGSNKKHTSRDGAVEYYRSLYANPITGEIDPEDYKKALEQALMHVSPKGATFSFVEEGPDNIGGRTRAIIVDVNDDNIVYAGGVSGGLYKSTNGGNFWTRLSGWDNVMASSTNTNLIGSLSISSVVMTANGYLYVGTGGGSQLGDAGLSGEGSGMQSGDGVWVSTDNGASFSQVSGTEGKEITRLAADLNASNRVYFTGASQGLKRIDGGTVSSMPISNTNLTTTCVSVSPDGTVIIVTSGSKVYVSQNSGSSFFEVYGSGAGMIPTGSSRKECAVSYDKNSNDKWTLYVAGESSGKIRGIYISEDNGSTWHQIAPASTTGWEPCISRNGQCYYDMTIDAVPGHPDHCIFGGIDLYRWERTAGNDPSNGQWQQITQWSYPQQSPLYVHADNHRLTWNSQGSLYVGNDGGIQRSFDNTTTGFSVMNKGYNVTQFYGIGVGPDGEVIGGAQDNGSSFNNHSGFTGKEFRDVNGGDGFECEVSFLNGDAIISSVYSASIRRSEDEGVNSQSVNPPCGSLIPGESCGNFYTALRLFEDDNDQTTRDSIKFVPDSNMVIGDVVVYYSENFSLPLSHVLTQDLVVLYDTVIPLADSVLPNYDTIPGGVPYLYNPQPQDSIMLPDTKQSMFVTQGFDSINSTSAIFLTRDILKFAITPEWWEITTGTGQSYEFSKNGDVLWIGSPGGKLTRVMGLDSAYSAEAADISYRPTTGDTIKNILTSALITSGFATIDYRDPIYQYAMADDTSMVTYKLFIKTIVGSGNIITDIATDPTNYERVAYTTGSSSGSVYMCTNATSASPTFSDKGGSATTTGIPSYAVFGVEFIRNDNGDDILMVGTEFGVYSTDNPTSGNPTWTHHYAETGMVPVFDVRQQWRNWSEGVKNPYAVYLGTHGRGAWRSDNVLAVQNENPIVEEVKAEISNISVYPNPLSSEGKLAFELGNRNDVEFNIYNLQGKLIRSLQVSQLAAGKHVMNFNADVLPVGTYIVTLKVGNTKEVTKFVKY